MLKQVKPSIKWLVIAVGIVVVLIINFILSTSTVRIVASNNSWTTKNLYITTSRDGHTKLHKLPYTTRLKNGEYSITAWGVDTAVQTRNIKVNNVPQTVEIDFRKIEGEDYLDLYGLPPSTNPYSEMFPHSTVEYEIKANYTVNSNNKFEIASYVITVSHRFFSPSDSEYAQEREAAVESAKQWLSDKGLPTDLPITIIE